MLRPLIARFFALLAGCLLATFTSALAQPLPAGVTPAQISDPHDVGNFATCIVERHSSEAAAFVIGKYADWRARPATTLGELKDKRCVPAQLSNQNARLLLNLPEDDIRAALAEVLVRREFPRFDAAVIQMAAPLPSSTLVESLYPPDACKKCGSKQMVQFQDARAKLNSIMAPVIFGECAVRTDPANAHALLMTRSGSPEEKSVFGSLAPAFGNCVVQGAQFATTRSVLRGLIAISYYRVAHAPRLGEGPRK